MVWDSLNWQKRLEESKVCLLNCGPTGCETVKNLVLGGIASFTLVDKDTVKPLDLGNNFMLSTTDVGESRAKAVAAHLKELNAAVVGSFIDEDPEDIVTDNPDFFHDFTIVIATQMPMRALIALDSVCRKRNIIMIVIRSFGFIGTLRLCIREHVITDTNPGDNIHDLGLTQPWPELCNFVSQFELDTLDGVAFKRVPFIVLLLQACDKWRAEHDSKLPSNTREQAAFKHMLSAMRRTHDEENFQEALNAVRHVCKPKSLSPTFVKVLEELASKNLCQSTPIFWFKISGISAFLAKSGGTMPLVGNIPDMTCTTDCYVTLQRIYQEKAASDAKVVEHYVQEALVRAGRQRDEITADEVRTFCRYASNAAFLRWRPLALDGSLVRQDIIESTSQGARDYPLSTLTYLVLVCASDAFFDRYGRLPGTAVDALHDSKDDFIKLKTIADEILGDHNLNVHLLDNLICETVRSGGGELHAVASVLGAIGSQEIIKLVTKQFVPCEKTLIYNCADCTTMTC